MVKLNIAQLLEKEMDRKDFLKHVGIGVIALTGLSTILKTLVQQPTSQSKAQTSYGSSVYGGVSKR